MTAPAHMTRDQALRTAVLSAIEYWRPFYSMDWLKGWMTTGRPLPQKFLEQIVTEFRRAA